MGGKSSSSNTNVNNSVNTSNSLGISGNGNISLNDIGGGIQYSSTDHGAIEMAGELAGESLGLAGHSIDSSLSFGSELFGGALSFGNEMFSGALDSINNMAEKQSNLASQSMAFAGNVNASLATQGQSDINGQNTKMMLGMAALMALVLLVVLFRGKG